jgi:hypothetical protein
VLRVLICCVFRVVLGQEKCFLFKKKVYFQRMYSLHIIIITWIYSSFSGAKFHGDTAHY